MRRFCSAGVVLMLLLSWCVPIQAAPEEKFALPTGDSILDGEQPKDEEKAGQPEEKGDGQRFTIKTDSDISTLEVNDVYASANSKFKVVQIVSKSSTGGKFIVERITGMMDPDRKLSFTGGRPKDRKPPGVIVTTLTLLDYYIMGGPFLHPIAALGFLTILLAINSLWIFRRRMQLPPQFVSKARRLLDGGQLEKFEDLSLKQKGLLPYVCRAMVDRFNSSSVEDIKERVQVAASGQINRLRLPVRLLNLIAAAAPLLGLLGTIVGMVIVFEAVASATGAQKAAALAAGIRVKLFATATALMVAIPALFLYFIFNARLSGIIADCEALTEEFFHQITKLKRTGHTRPERREVGRNNDEDEDENVAPAPVRKPSARSSAQED